MFQLMPSFRPVWNENSREQQRERCERQRNVNYFILSNGLRFKVEGQKGRVDKITYRTC